MFTRFSLHPLLLALCFLCTATAAYAQRPDTDSIRQAIERMPDDTAKVLQMRVAVSQLINSQPDEARQYMLQMRDLSARLGYPKGTALSYDVEGNLLRRTGDYATALEKHFAALRIWDSLGSQKGIRGSAMNLGSDYTMMKNYDKAMFYFNLSLSKTDTADHLQLVTIYNNIGNAYSFSNQHRKAINAFLKVLPYVNEDTTFRTQSFFYGSIATGYARLNDYDNAIRYMLEAIRYQKLLGDKMYYASSASTIAGFYIEQKQFDKARYYLSESYNTATEVNARALIATYYMNMSQLFLAGRNYKQAYEYLTKFNTLNDSLISKEHIEQMAEAESRYHVDTKNKELALLNAEKLLDETTIRKERQLKLFLGGVLLLALVLLVLSFRNMKLKQKANRLLLLEKQLVEDERGDLEQKNTLLKHENVIAQYETLKTQVNPHFLFNSLNALSSLMKNDVAKAQQFTTAFSRLYRSVLELKSDMVITVAEELQLCDDYIHLQKIRFGESLNVEKHIDPEAMMMYLPPFCLQMLLENAIKHNIISTQQPLYIRITSEDDRILVSNNIQKRSDKSESTGTGIANITGRFRILSDRIPEFTVTHETYIARIPLITEEL
jgi:hypothetical protein